MICETCRQPVPTGNKMLTARVTAAVSEVTGVTVEAILGESRRPSEARARTMVAQILINSGLGRNTIADLINRDRATVYSALIRGDEWMKDPAYKSQFKRASKALKL